MAELITQAEHARRCNVSRVAVTKWKGAGKLTMVGALVDFEASYKGEAWHAGVQKARQPAAAPKPTQAAQSVPARHAAPEPAPPRADAPEVAPNGSSALKEAVTRKEEYAGRLRELEFLKSSGRLIDIDAARKVLFDEARAARDAWLNWVPRSV